MRDFLVILLHWREVAELLHDIAHGLCAVSDSHHVHADNHERNMRRRAVALFNKRGLTLRAPDAFAAGSAFKRARGNLSDEVIAARKERR